MADRFRIEFPAEPESLASMRALLRRWLRHAEGSDREIAEVITACGEAATNAIEHAGSGGGAPFEVSGRARGPQRSRSRCATSAPGARRATAIRGAGCR